ncbi:MAG: hypothetical protein ACKVTZ_23075 [Bacteroidia bacterium]
MKHIRAYFWLLIVMTWVCNLTAQPVQVGQWKSYLGHLSGIQSTANNGVMYCATERGFFTYDVNTNESSTYSTVEGLSGNSPSTIFYHKAKSTFFMGYEDGKIDRFSNPAEIRSMNDIYRNEFYIQKRINEFAESPNLLFVATSFGVVVYDLDKFLPKYTISQIANNPIRSEVRSIAVYNNRIWVAMESSGLYSAALNSTNLSDPDIWQKETSATGYPDVKTIRLIAKNDRLLALNEQNLFENQNGTWVNTNKGASQDLFYSNGYVFLSKGQTCEAWGDDGSFRKVDNIDGGNIRGAYLAGNTQPFYVLNIFFGLRKWENNTFTNLTPSSPRSNTSLRIAAGNGEFYYAPGGYTAEWIPLGNGIGFFHYNDNNKWTNLNAENGSLPQGHAYADFSRAYYDENSGKAYMGSWGQGLAVAKDGVLEKYYDCSNSDITYIYSNASGTGCDFTVNASVNTRVSGIAQDNNGLIWLSFAYAQNYLMAFNPQTETFYKTQQSYFLNNAQVTDLLIDDYGGKWVLTSSHITIYYDNNTPENLADDYSMRLNGGKGQGNMPTGNAITSFAKDLEGNVWVGTAQGIYIMYANNVYDLSKKKLQDADEPNYDGYRLLRTDIVTAIAVDGGNRKWLGTKNGLYLVDADGESVIYRITTENSPLLSNVINDISIDHSTGEVFVATDLGLQSFRGDAIRAANPCNSVFIFPNPVFSDYEGMVSFQGLGKESKVKITSISGFLIKEIDSQGGMATWDGRDMWGNKVNSGVYLALSAGENGDNACIGKFSVIAR